MKYRKPDKYKKQIHQWLSAISMTGLVLSEPVLYKEFPEGPTTIDDYLLKRLNNEFERFSVSGETDDVHRWTNFILEDLLGINASIWNKSNNIPEKACVVMEQFNQTLKPSRVILHNNDIKLMVLCVDKDQNIDKIDKQQGKWKASPATKLDRMLRDTGTRLGLLTNGSEFRLMYAEPGLNTFYMTWTAQGWHDEHSTLYAFRMLLEKDRLIEGSDKRLLIDLIKESQEKQIAVADQLGTQIREAIGIFISDLDRLDKNHNGMLLEGYSNDEIYEIAVVVMMCIVFLLYAEENGLLPHGEVLYDYGYGVNHLAFTLQKIAIESATLEQMDCQTDAWQSLLATFRLIYNGCRFSELNMIAYGGNLFNPDRFVAKDTNKPLLEDVRFSISNKTIYEILNKLTHAKAKLGKDIINQRVSYNTLDVEHIGYMYEGLLDHTVLKADDVILKLIGKNDVYKSLTELIVMSQTQNFIKSLHEVTARPVNTIEKALESQLDVYAYNSLMELAGDKYYNDILPFINIISLDFIAFPGDRYIGISSSRRSTGTHYTPQILTEPIVRNTLAPLVYENPDTKTGIKTPKEILDLKIADIAMGSAAFLVQAIRYMSDRLLESWDSFEAQHPDIPVTPYGETSMNQDDDFVLPVDRDERLLIAKRLIAEHCIYGVDINPLAVEIAKLSMWLVTFAKAKPFSFLDHGLKVGDSLLGVNMEQLKYFSLKVNPQEPQKLSFAYDRINKDLERVKGLRNSIQNIMVKDIEDIKHKVKLLKESEDILVWLKIVGNLLIAKELKPDTATAESDFMSYIYDNKDIPLIDLSRFSKIAEGYNPFHFDIEFPEVFIRDRSGFDGIVGNPPFKGGQHLTGILGVPYREYLVNILANGKRGSADLCAYFFLNGFNKLAETGKLGLIATNTIAQGDTREVGLDQIAKNGGDIFNTVPTMVWPGVAAVSVSKVHISKTPYIYQKTLDEQKVNYISAFLDASNLTESPYQLKANEGKSFQGSIVLGLGFVLESEEAEALIEKNPKNEDVLYPYLNGEDLNSRPDQSPSRWVVNFHDWLLNRNADRSWSSGTDEQRKHWLQQGIVPADYPEPVAEDYPDCLAIVEEKVKPERDLLSSGDATAKDRARRWWQFARPTIKLYSTLCTLVMVLISSRVTKYIIHTYSSSKKVFDVGTNVIVDVNLFSVLDSNIYGLWVKQFASTLETRIRYILEDCFETFPFPNIANNLKDIGEAYYNHRQSIMQTRQEGLTQTYNRFHNKNETSADIQKLRELQIEMDKAVAHAYGWDDLNLKHDFYVVSSILNKDSKRVEEIRFTVSPENKEEILLRLLKLNHERYDEEVKQGLHDKKNKVKTKKSKISDTNISQGSLSI